MGLGSGPATAVADPAAALAAVRGGAAGEPAPRARVSTPTPTPLPSPWPLPTAALQTRLDSLRLKYGVPGVSVTIIWPDGRTWTGVSGWANLSHRVPVVSGTAFAVGSVTKTFVAALVLQLASEGKFRLDDRVRTYLPTAKVNAGVTIRQMLNHTSGTYDFFSNPRIDASILADKRRVWSESRSLSFVLGAYFHSGRGWHYSNTNYVQLGQLVRKVTGHSVTAEIRRRFLDPLGMSRTFMQGAEAKHGTVATAYVVSGSGSTLRRVSLADGTSIAPFTSVTTAAGSAGAIASSSRDLAVWARALYAGDVLDAGSIAAMEDVSASVAHDSWVPYGLGFMDESLGGRETFGHSGRLIGARASMRYLPATGFTIAVVTNQDRTNPDTFGTALMNIVKPDTWVTPAP
jgi:D-alanyl-D-alanine carboxypeptidase